MKRKFCWKRRFLYDRSIFVSKLFIYSVRGIEFRLGVLWKLLGNGKMRDV